MSDQPPSIPSVPRATARLQFTGEFRFADATAVVPYLAGLGISHLYASPFLKARPGSSHGYDIIDHTRFNPELGEEADFEAMVAALHAHGMGLILDFVPNHMGVGGADNPWWLDVLEWGEASPYAPFFDINWEAGADGGLLLPVLGDQYGAVLERGELQLRLDEGGFSVWYFTHRFPVAVRDYPRLLRLAWDRVEQVEDRQRLGEVANAFAAIAQPGRNIQKQALVRRDAEERKQQLARLVQDREPVRLGIDRMLERFNGEAGRPDSFRDLHQLLERQAYRVAFWRVAADEINYRRFFDINELAGLRIERPELFELAHQLVFRLIGEGKLQGLRIDHIDGLYDPEAYAEQLQNRGAYLTDRALAAVPQEPGAPRLDAPLYVVVEKILARHEHLREAWPVNGTTGYEFMVQLAGLFVDPAAEAVLTETYAQFLEREAPFEEMQIAAKRLILAYNLSAELNVLAQELHSLARQSWATRDHTRTGIRRALTDVISHFPVYRTYVTEKGATEEDRRYIDWAVARARRDAEAAVDLSVYDFIHAALTGDLARDKARGYRPADVTRIAMKAQQLTGPVMAKAVEDTLFYRYVRLVCLNEVGGDPDRFGLSPAAFHKGNQERLRHWPHQLLATATHDHKRGADTRVRIAVLSEMPEEWARAAKRWSRLNRLKKRQGGDERPAPGRNDEYLLYQTLVGAWPLDLAATDADGLRAFAERVQGYMLKAVRESKYRSNWAQPNADYEEALARFVGGILDPERSAAFLEDLAAFVAKVAPAGAVNGLAQTLLKATAPGVPDLYQGEEYWDLSLVDPDNRRPVDWPARHRSLEAGTPPADLLAEWRDGRVKQHVLAAALRDRRDRHALYAEGEYVPVEASGAQADRVLAFLRRREGQVALVVVPRLALALLGDGAASPAIPAEAWGDTVLHLPEIRNGEGLSDLVGGVRVELPADGRLPVGTVLRHLPVALLARG